MKACVIIPARYASTRFPGKPLVPLLGKAMVLWVAELSARAVGKEHVYVATEDDRIARVIRSAGFVPLMTSPNAITGTDRVAEAATLINYDIYVNVQGDEPMVNPRDIQRCIELKSRYPDYIINAYCWIGLSENPASVNLPKVITNENELLVYSSRGLLPGYKDSTNAPHRYKKQVCIYAFNINELAIYSNFGRKSTLERHEDIEILRFFELNKNILMYECSGSSLAVDVPGDVETVEALLSTQL
jgi:3-deoxy-manno-octulosonate cytidylyltransferase (CMP-KDO synthetase)